MRLLIAGAPGSGKGTQSRRVSGVLGIPHVSTGDLLRDAIRLGTPLGYGASESVAEGRLVPDGLVNELVQARLARADVRERGFLLDGFPRNLEQLDALTLWLVPDGLDAAIELAMPNEVALQRLATRRRTDDTTPVIRERLEAFERETTPLLRRLDADGLLVSIDGDRPIDEVTQALLESIRKHRRPTDAMNLPTNVE
jgi:adenylate kinase